MHLNTPNSNGKTHTYLDRLDLERDYEGFDN